MPKQITAIIVDDEQDALDSLERIINTEIPEISIVGITKNAQNALEVIINEQPDLVFLDIQMPVNDGFWLADKINKLKLNTCIIFTTAHDEYSIKAIKHAAFDFLTKPIIPQVLRDTVDRYKANSNISPLAQKLENLKAFLNNDKLKFNTYNGFFMVTAGEIIYCQAERNYCNIFLSNGKTKLVTSQLGVIEKKLTEKSFVKVNRSTLINLDYLEDYNRKEKKIIIGDVFQKFEISVSSSGAKRLMGI